MRTTGHEAVIIFYKPQYFVQCGRATQLGSFLTAWIHRIYSDEVRHSDNEYRNLQNIFSSLIELSHLKFDLLHILMLHGILCQMALIINNFFKHFKNIKMIFQIPLNGSKSILCAAEVEIERIKLHNNSVQYANYEDMCKDNDSNSESSMDSAQFPHLNANS